jgi:hypothetical protein
MIKYDPLKIERGGQIPAPQAKEPPIRSQVPKPLPPKREQR